MITWGYILEIRIEYLALFIVSSTRYFGNGHFISVAAIGQKGGYSPKMDSDTGIGLGFGIGTVVGFKLLEPPLQFPVCMVCHV